MWISLAKLAARWLVGGAIGVGVGNAATEAVNNRIERRDELNDRIDRERQRWKRRRKRFKSLMSGKGQDSTPTHASDTKGRERIDLPKASSQLEIVDEHGGTVLALSEIPDPNRKTWKSVHGSDHPICKLNPLLSAVPIVGIEGNVAKSGYYVVESGGPLMNASSGGFRGMVRGPKGIQEHATLFKADQLASLANMAVLWQIASVALAQKHLHDISKTLKNIESGIRGIIQFQKGERKSKILGTIEHFMEISDEVDAGGFRLASEGMIESALHQLRQIGNHLKEDLDWKLSDLAEISEFDFSEDSTLEGFEEVVDLLYQMHLCIVARLCGCQILAIASPEQEHLPIRIRNIRNDYMEQFGRNVCYVFEIIEKLFREDEASFWDDLSKVEGFLGSVDKVLPCAKLENSVKSFQKAGIRLEMIVKQRNEPEPILIKVNQGKVEEFSVI